MLEGGTDRFNEKRRPISFARAAFVGCLGEGKFADFRSVATVWFGPWLWDPVHAGKLPPLAVCPRIRNKATTLTVNCIEGATRLLLGQVVFMRETNLTLLVGVYRGSQVTVAIR